jgi:hypothetical protein
MRTVSSRFLASVRQSHQIVVQAELLFPANLGSSVPVPVEGGSITHDRTALIRRTGTVQIPWSLDAGADLGLDLRTLPLGGYCILSRGIRFPDGTVELARLGVLRVESVSWLTAEDRASLELADRMAQVRDESFTAPYAGGGKLAATAAAEIVQQVFGGGITYQTLYSPPITLADVFYSGSRADAVTGLANSIAGEVYFDADGNYVFDGAPGSVAITRNGTLTDDTAVVKGLSTTSDLAVGMNVYGMGLPPGRRIKSIDSSSQITLTGPVNTWALKNAAAVAGTPTLTMISDTTDLTVGMTVFEPHTPAGAKIKSIDGSDQVTLDKNVGASTANYEFLFNFQVPNPVTLTFTGQTGSLGDPVWLIDTGDTGVMLEAEEALDRTGVYNGVLVEGQNTGQDAPVSGLVYDSDPTSPTRWGGPFGKVVRLETNSAVSTATQASQAADALLDRKLGLTRSIVLTIAPNPALEAGDIVDVAFEDGRRERHVIDSLQLDLGPEGSQRLSVRSVFQPAAGRLHADLPRRYRTTRYGREAWREARRARRVRIA